ncbi:GAK system CofD-like protein [Marinomonas balearica]|uniref:CofD-related protein of GAK system n=1 Tax=Marinomonas balearica TaxID=491947 RepID=A0A4R6M2N9_9GAMM|nr:GAK system CofD-like protein [Marinomonas balearica]TDO95521.1 CofD-related protein of GAK system [Marinomonas balearica]
MKITRRLKLPDSVRLHRYKSLPEQGPKILFFSGGSALNKISRVLKSYTHNSVHLVTPFDSGGSSAHLRNEFDMPAVGDLRSRLMALADETVLGQPEVYELFTYRFSKSVDKSLLEEEFDQLVHGMHPLILPIPDPMKSLIQTQLSVTKERIGDMFDLKGASIGNLIIAGGYLNNQQQLDPIVFLFSRLVKTLGQVKTVVDTSLHLGTHLENGNTILGQHNLTGKETQPLQSPIGKIWLNDGLDEVCETSVTLSEDRKADILDADLICFPPGSFFSSLVANLLPDGVASAVKSNPNPKIYIPNLGVDPEQLGWSLMKRVRWLANLNDSGCVHGKALDILLMDEHYDYGNLDVKELNELGVSVVKTPLISTNQNKYDEVLVNEALLSMT